MSQQTQYRIILFYVFTQLADPEAVRLWQFTLAQSLGLRGRVIVSVHGINATLGGELGAIKTYVRALKGYAPFRGADVKWFQGTGEDFPRLLTQRKCGGGEMVTSCADLRIAQQMDPRSMSVDLSREGDEYVPEANLPGIDSEPIELGGRPADHRPRGERPSPRPPARSGSPPNGPQGQFMRLLGPAPGIDSDSVTASCDLGTLRVVMHIEQPAVRKDRREAACFLTLGTQPCACADPGALFEDPCSALFENPCNVSHETRPT
ncbi:hypothetical protein M3F59_13235 [Brachybacterium muris]|uniref:hypothetical protein n=1 Tax=Brachybacterium muris TaxID=219301 RepID=UPI00223B05FB|nr:hypothetical protein [Brachybacterium muris]MCT2296552.1 hypothetical protein [Brachybacterium muris]